METWFSFTKSLVPVKIQTLLKAQTHLLVTKDLYMRSTTHGGRAGFTEEVIFKIETPKRKRMFVKTV